MIVDISESGLKFMFDVKTTLNISDMTFYPSQTTHGYDLYASAVDKEDILFLNLVTGKHINYLYFFTFLSPINLNKQCEYIKMP